MGRKVEIRLLSPDDVLEISYGQIKKDESFNYRTLEPIEDGLFCMKIFGPINSYECHCKRYKGIGCKGIKCEKCKVDVVKNSERRKRSAHIEFPVKLVHPLFLRSSNNKIAALLDMSVKDIKRLAYLEVYIIIDVGTSNFALHEIITETTYNIAIKQFYFVALTGGEALYEFLSKIDMDAKIVESRKLYTTATSEATRKKNLTILQILTNMKKANVRPEYMILDRILVVPCDLRPLVELQGGQFVSSDLNELYRRLLYRINSLEKFKEIGIDSMSIIYNHARRLAQDALAGITGSSETEETKKTEKEPKSLQDRLKGKGGLFRKYLLGKRIDFSGRAVIAVDYTLDLNECKLPQVIVLELFKPALVFALKAFGLANSLSTAKKMIDNKHPRIWDLLQELIDKYFPYILLNRAPTLHRVSIMAFKIQVTKENVIKLNPLVCTAFNADFDGDTMSCLLQLSLLSQAEALLLMAPSNHPMLSTTGKLTFNPRKDILSGIYHLTLASREKYDKPFANMSEVEHAVNYKIIEYGTLIKVLVAGSIIITTAGRLLFWKTIPLAAKVKFIDVNKSINGTDIEKLMHIIYKNCGADLLASFTNHIKNLGFKFCTYYTGSFGLEDFPELPNSNKFKEKSIEKQKKLYHMYNEGQLSDSALKMGLQDIAQEAKSMGQKEIEEFIEKNPENPCISIIKSQATGSIDSLLQISLLHGIQAGIDGVNQAFIIFSNFMQSPTNVIESFILSFTARRGVKNIVLSTAESGYLTRRLVDAVNSIIISDFDCNTKEYWLAKNIFKEGLLQSDVYENILNRVTAIDIKGSNGRFLLPKNTLINDDCIQLLKENDITEVPIRSAIFCNEPNGVCRRCYGADLSTCQLVQLGEAAGIIAAQAMGEPATQLTMKSGKQSNAAVFGNLESLIKTPFDGRVEYENINLIKNRKSEFVNISRNSRIIIKNKNDMIAAEFDIQYGSILFVKNNQLVSANDTISSLSIQNPIIAEIDGKCLYTNLVEGVTYEYNHNLQTGNRNKITLRDRISPTLILKNKEKEIVYFIPENTILLEEENTEVLAGDLLGYTIVVQVSQNIVDELQDVVGILENRAPKQLAILAPFDGLVKLSKDSRGRNTINITDSSKNLSDDITAEFGSILSVQNEQQVKKGQMLTVGKPLLQEVLDKCGVSVLLEVFIKEIQSIYKQSGLTLNVKHIEIVLKSMLKLKVIQSFHEEILDGDEMEYAEYMDLPKKVQEKLTLKLVINGIKNTALYASGWLARVSFQDTTKGLCDVVVGYKNIDNLNSLKSALIAGDVLRVGSGFAYLKMMEEAKKIMQQKHDETENVYEKRGKSRRVNFDKFK